MANWIQRFLTAIATHKADAAAHHHVPLWDEIGDHVVSGAEASISFSSIPSGYSVFQLILLAMKGDDLEAKKILITFNDDTEATHYDSVTWDDVPTLDTIPSLVSIADSDNKRYRISGQYWIQNPDGYFKTAQGQHTQWHWEGVEMDSRCVQWVWHETDEITKITLTPAGGNFDGGKVILLGLKT